MFVCPPLLRIGTSVFTQTPALNSWLMRCIYRTLMALLLMPLMTNAQQSMTVLTSPLPVFSQVQDNGKKTGYSVEFATAVLKRAGYNATFQGLPFARLLKRANDGEAIVATGIGRIPEREDDFYWLAPMTANVVGLYSKQLTTISDFRQLDKAITVSVLRGDYRTTLLADFPAVTIVEFNNWQQAVSAVLKGRVDAVLFSEFGIGLTCKNNGFDCSALKNIYSHGVLKSYLAMPKTDQNRHIAQQIARAAAHYVKSQDFVRLTQRWLPMLTEVSSQVSITDGVITMGAISDKKKHVNPLWVITHLEPPFSYRDERGRLTGYAVELTRNLLVEIGQQTDILVAPWQRIFVESETKSDVLVFSLARTKEREEQFHWITPITQNAYSIFGRHPLPQGTTLDTLPRRSKIAVLKNDFRHAVVTSAGLRSITGETWAEVMELFLSGTADYVFFSDGGVALFCARLALDCSDVQKVIEYQLATTYLALSKKGTHPKLADQLKRAATVYKQSKDYQQLVDYWLAEISKQSPLLIHENDGMIKLWAQPN